MELELELEPCLLAPCALSTKPLEAFYLQTEITSIWNLEDLEGTELLLFSSTKPPICVFQ